MDKYNFLTANHKDQQKSQYVRFEDTSADRIKNAEPREGKVGKILNDDEGNKGTILGGAADAILNATKDILLNQNPASSFVFLTNFLSKPSTGAANNNRITGGQQQTNVEAFIDEIDEYDHRSGYTQKVLIIIVRNVLEKNLRLAVNFNISCNYIQFFHVYSDKQMEQLCVEYMKLLVFEAILRYLDSERLQLSKSFTFMETRIKSLKENQGD